LTVLARELFSASSSESVDEMVAELGVPLAGFQTYGEICMQQGEMRGYHNTTSSVLVFPE